MKRDMQKAIDEFNRRFTERGRDVFFVSDINAIRDISESRSGTPDPCTMVINALSSGFMIGYRFAQADARKRKTPVHAAT